MSFPDLLRPGVAHPCLPSAAELIEDADDWLLLLKPTFVRAWVNAQQLSPHHLRERVALARLLRAAKLTTYTREGLHLIDVDGLPDTPIEELIDDARTVLAARLVDEVSLGAPVVCDLARPLQETFLKADWLWLVPDAKHWIGGGA
ncbi:hypothetical protein L6R46_06065 [Myxococcota bacterium]|nr:hypothetical protein [Myxococcota bacterium]